MALLRLFVLRLFVLAVMGILVPATAICRAAEPVRGVWVASVGSGSLMSDEAIDQLVATSAEAGINTLFVVVWNRGVTLYPSSLMEREFGTKIDKRLAGRDPLKKIITSAHERGLKVFAWFEFGFSSSYGDPTGGPLLQKRPEWAARTVEGEIVSKNNFQWMNAFDPEVQDFLLAMMQEVVANYDVDGVQGDDRLPANPATAGYDPLTVELYKAEHNGQAPPKDPLDTEWIDWRCDRLSQFAERAYKELKATDPELVVSWAPSVYPWSKVNYLQDWPRWVREGYCDLVCPQIYRDNAERYEHDLKVMLDTQVDKSQHHLVAPGILIKTAGGWKVSDDYIRQTVKANRRAGLQGEVFFYYRGLEDHESAFDDLYSSPAAGQ